MLIVLIVALGVGGATVFGAIVGFFSRRAVEKISDATLAFAGGVMLIASINSLIMPSLEGGGKFAVVITLSGIIFGAALIFFLERLFSGLNLCGEDRRGKLLIFVLAIAIHNLPEGIAAGVGFGSGDLRGALTLAFGIALQNVPEGMVVIAPMLSAGFSAKKAFFFAALTGAIEVLGTFAGYFAVSFAKSILPFSLALAGGTMIYVISEQIIPETHTKKDSRGVALGFLLGFCLMLAINYYI